MNHERALCNTSRHMGSGGPCACRDRNHEHPGSLHSSSGLACTGDDVGAGIGVSKSAACGEFLLLLPDCALHVETADRLYTLRRRRERSCKWRRCSCPRTTPIQSQARGVQRKTPLQLQFCSVFHSTRTSASATAAPPRAATHLRTRKNSLAPGSSQNLRITRHLAYCNPRPQPKPFPPCSSSRRPHCQS